MGAERCGEDGLRGRVLWLYQAGGLALRLGRTWEVDAWEIPHLGSSTWENKLGKLPFGKNSLGKYLNIFNGVTKQIVLQRALKSRSTKRNKHKNYRNNFIKNNN